MHLYMHAYAFVWAHCMCIYVCRGPGLVSGIIPSHSSTSFIEVGLSIPPRTPGMISLITSLFCLCLTQLELQVSHHAHLHLWRPLEIWTLVLMLEWQMLQPVSHLSSPKFSPFIRLSKLNRFTRWSNKVHCPTSRMGHAVAFTLLWLSLLLAFVSLSKKLRQSTNNQG